MTRRNATSSTCTNGDSLAYDTENKLTSITVGGTTTTYAYDGDGSRVKRSANGVTSYYIGNHYEVTVGGATSVLKYYYFGKQRIALRNSSGVVYLHSDHLGSISATSGATSSAQTYYPFGSIRTTTGGVPTDFGFTGQRRDTSANLMYYNARYYDPTLGRFITADTMVATAGSPQGLNRYAYALNNPVKYVDPSGHCINDTGEMTRDTYFDCTVGELAGLSWDTRKTWLGHLASAARTEGWFNNINGIIDFFSQNSSFSDLDGWASWADAGVLQAIQDGFRQSRPQSLAPIGSCTRCANLWSDFFTNFSGNDRSKRIMAWATAEQSGIEYCITLGDANAPVSRVTSTILWNNPGGDLIHNFLEGSNFYRYLGSIPNGEARFGGAVGGYTGNATCGPVCATGGNIVGGYFGGWFVDPTIQTPVLGNSPVYWSAWLITAYTSVGGPALPTLPKPALPPE